jgi:phospholipase C
MKLNSKALAALSLAAVAVLTACQGVTGGTQTTTTTTPPSTGNGTLQSVNHVVFMLQENRSFDHYFGKLGDYRARQGFGSATDIDGVPANATNPADTLATLTWTSSNAQTVTVTASDGRTVGSTASGFFNDSPASTLRYTAVATGATGTARAELVLAVFPLQGSLQAAASPLQIRAGDSALLTWAAGSNTRSVTITCSPCATVPLTFRLPYGPVGSATVNPAATTTYSFTARDPGGNVTGTTSVTVTVGPITGPQVTLNAAPLNISTGAAVNLAAFKLNTVCPEDLSPDWLESHGIMNRDNPASSTVLMNGYAHVGAGFAQFSNTSGSFTDPSNGIVIPFHDVQGARGMGFFDETVFPYYYFMAAQFGVGDRFFSPIPSNSAPNRIAMFAATTAGHAHRPNAALSVPTIWHRLEDAHISWKIYYTDSDPQTGRPATELWSFQPFGDAHQANVVPLDQYFRDVAAGTLPQVAFIESGYTSSRDEHPGTNVQMGAAYVANIINALMNSPSWKDSVFFLTWDEGGAEFDHVPPAAAVSPDGIKPLDLLPKDPVGPDFTVTGFRLPNIVISPFTKKHFVSHTVMDYTSYLKFIETRFNLQPLTRRDAAQPDMTEYFDFAGAPWATPPTPPTQPTNGQCYFDRLP